MGAEADGRGVVVRGAVLDADLHRTVSSIRECAGRQRGKAGEIEI
jgi:hypothetical protein